MLKGNPVPRRRLMRRLLAGVAAAGYKVDGLVKLDLELVTVVLRLWNQECCAGLDLGEEWQEYDDGEHAWRTLKLLYENSSTQQIVLDENAVSLIWEVSQRAAVDGFVSDTAQGDPPEELDAMGRWATARSRQGDDGAALAAYAYIQEQADPDELDCLYWNRAMLFMERSRFEYALTDIQMAIEIRLAKSTWSEPQHDSFVAECYRQLAEIALKLEDCKGAADAMSQFVDSLAAHAEMPRVIRDGDLTYCIDDERGHVTMPRPCLVSDLAGAIELVKQLEAMVRDDAMASLNELKAKILALRGALEEHWQEAVRATAEDGWEYWN